MAIVDVGVVCFRGTALLCLFDNNIILLYYGNYETGPPAAAGIPIGF
jgi:hypothetical protein